MAAYDLGNKEAAIVVRAGFILENTGDIDTTVDVWAEGALFYGMSDKKKIFVPSKTTISVVENFQFASYRMPSGIGEIEETITWKCSDNSVMRESINVKLYFILSNPKSQWYGNPIWADALRYIIPKMKGLSDIQRLYRGITEAINAEKQLSYIPITNYVELVSKVYKIFYFSQFLSDMFRREQPDGKETTYRVNCTDCAAIVMSFANMLGGNLYCERMQNTRKDSPFSLNPIIPIGNSEIGSYNAFVYHETAMRHDGTDNDKNNTVHKVYDASLKIEVPLCGCVASAGMSFSQYTDEHVHKDLAGVQAGSDSYRECLCPITLEGVGSCDYDVQEGYNALPAIV